MCIQAHGLSGEQLAAREVEIIDIASVSRDYWSKAIGAPSVDLTAFKSQRTERGPLLKGWMVRSKQHRFFFFLFFFSIRMCQCPMDICCSLQDSCHPVMTTYKLVTMDAPIWGLGERLEDCIIAVRRPADSDRLPQVQRSLLLPSSLRREPEANARRRRAFR
jgi:hypothetical protein